MAGFTHLYARAQTRRGLRPRIATATCLTVALALSVGCNEGKVGPNSGLDRGGNDVGKAGDGPGDREQTGADRKSTSCSTAALQPVNRVRIYPAAGKAEALVGVRIEGSNTSPTNGFVELVTVDAAPKEGAFTELKFDNDQVYRWVKLHGLTAGTGSFAELELYHDDTQIEGDGFGTAPAGGGGNGFDLGLDGDVATEFEAKPEGGSYVGLDVGNGAVAGEVTLSPAPGNFDQAPEVTLTSQTKGAEIRYTLDGSTPTREDGTLYEGPFALAGRSNVKAVAFADCLFEGPVASGAYGIGSAAVTRGLKSYHIGNSLTDTINEVFKPIADSTGVEHEYARWTIPGAPISWLASHPGQGFGDPVGSGAQTIDTFAPAYAPIDDISLQPFSETGIEQEGAAAQRILAPVLASSPDVQVWLYSQWPVRDLPGKPTDNWKSNGMAAGSPGAIPPWNPPHPATNWEGATLSQEDFARKFAVWLDERIPGKPVKVVPGGRGLVLLKRAIEKGEVPGTNEFFNAHFDPGDDLHMGPKGDYMVALVFYAAMYNQSPEGRVTFNGPLTAEQARVYQRIAWQAVNQGPDDR